MLKNPIPKVTNQLQYRAIGIVNGKFTPKNNEQLNRGFLADNKGEAIETVVLGKALPLLNCSLPWGVNLPLIIPIALCCNWLVTFGIGFFNILKI